MYKVKDKRIFVRFDSELTIRWRKEGEAKEFFTTVNNISGSGINISIFKKITPGTVLDIEIVEDISGSTTKCRGEVVWGSTSEQRNRNIAPFKAGIRFLDTDLMYVGSLIRNSSLRESMCPTS